jgi:transglutaminase-like putative cysteine protease
MCTALLAVLLGLVGLPRYLAANNSAGTRLRVSETPSSSEASRSFRLHVWIATWCAGRRNDFEMTAARRRNLHLPINGRGRAYDALRPGEFVA